MHHLYPAAKGDPLCPLGFHPQVRWPTRCKRCFRDYKEHGSRIKDTSQPSLRRDDATSSSPSLSNWGSSSSRSRDDSRSSTDSGLSSRNSWSSGGSSSSEDSPRHSGSPSSSNSSSSSSGISTSRFSSSRPAMSWTSTPDLGNLHDDTKAEVTTVSFTLPRRRPPPENDTGQDTNNSDTFTLRCRSTTSTLPESKENSTPKSSSSTNTSSTAASKISQERTRQRLLTGSSAPSSNDTSSGKLRRIKIQSLKEVHSVEEPNNPEVEFTIQVKPKQSAASKAGSTSSGSGKAVKKSVPVTGSSGSSSSGSGTSSEDSYGEESDDDTTSLAGTETTETTLVDRDENELQEQIESLKQELEMMRTRCERVEREKSDILLRRVASIDMPTSKTAASEVLKLQQRVNELQGQVEDYRDDKKSLTLRLKELEEDIETRPDKNATQRTMDELRSKLLAAETLCEELMDENEDMKKELRDLEEEIEEMQDNFREDQADEYSSLKKELEQTAKNCRILSFKLRKAERKTEQLDAEKLEAEKKCREVAGGQSGLDKSEKITKLEHDLSLANEVANRLQKELDETKEKLKVKEEARSKEELKQTKKKAPMLGTLASGEKMSRESLTRGGSQDDPVQLLRDLQDAMEREADLREQLRFAEEEAQTLRKKSARIEDDNESLVLQLKKMATKARSRRHSPSPARLTPEPPNEKDEGISDEEDPAELRLLLELNEQEAGVLRRKVDELEREGDTMKRKVKELQDKLNVKTSRKSTVSSLGISEPAKGNALYEQKFKVLEEEVSDLRKKLIEKDRDCERLHAELTVSLKRAKGSIQKSKSLDSGNEQQALDLKRQLQVIEQEAAILRTRTQTLESDNEKLSAENKRLQLLRGAKKSTTPAAVNSEADKSAELKEKITALETQLAESNNKVTELQGKLEVQETAADAKKKTVTTKDADVTKLKKDIKSKTDELEKLKTETTKAESENVKLNEALNRLKEEAVTNAIKFYKQRTPKKPTEFTTKLQMKKMVEELESEIGEVLVVLKKSEAEKAKLKEEVKPVKSAAEDNALKVTNEKLEKSLEEVKKKLETMETELKEEREKAEKEKKKLTKEKKTSEDGKKKAEDEKRKLDEEKKAWDDQKKKLEEAKNRAEEEKKKAQEAQEKLKQEKKKLEEQISDFSVEKAAATARQDELAVFIQRVETLKKELEEEKRQGVDLRWKLDVAQKAEQEKTRLQKEITENNTKLTEAEKKAKETEDKLKKTERILTTNKNKVGKLEKELEEERERARANEVTQQGVAASWLTERDSLKKQLATLQSQADSLEVKLSGKAALIQQLEASVKEERERAIDASTKAGAAEKREMNSLKDELAANKGRLQELAQKLEKAEKNHKVSEEKFKKQELELKKVKTEMEKKASELEMDLQAERKKTERIKVTQEKELKNRDQELATLRTKLRSLESNGGVTNKKLTELRQEYQGKIDKLEDELSTERQEYEDLTAKYEILEEEHVVTKAQLVMEKETVQNQLLTTKRELGSVETELRTLRETYNSKQDAWIKEKLDQQERLKELEEKVSRSNNNDAWNSERNRLKASIEEKTVEIDQLRRESEVLADQMLHIKKENEELRRKLDDFDKVVKIQRNMTADTSAIDRQLREVRNKLSQEEKNHKADMAQLKLRYDSQVAVISDEITALQAQVTRFKRERDTFRHMLEGAQKTITELKAKPSKDSRTSSSGASGDESEETRTKIASLDQQISCMEDELSEARLESSKLKTELISERSSWEVKISEMQSRVNELEEDRILNSGRTKIPGMRTRMELAWQKEREEQHRLLQETSTLARDLRQTLFEVERERDKERLEAKRRHDQLKKTTEEDQDENRKKVTELQCDLLELRDAHAKLRTTNEKLRREKERNEKEREELRQLVSGRKRAEQEEERKINALLEQVEELMRLAPDLLLQKQKSTTAGPPPTPPIRTKGPKSRESSREASPTMERKPFAKESSVDRKAQLQSTVQRLNEVTEELRKYQRIGEEERDRERARRTIGMRRAASTESENPPETGLKPKSSASRGVQKKGSLYRKSLSLEQTSAQDQESIWKTDDENDGSMSSLQSMESGDSRFFSLHRRETSMDSRLSGGSTQSEVIHTNGDKKKKKGILGKLKKLTKSRSIDETTSGGNFSAPGSAQGSAHGGSGSDISIGAEDKGSKKDLRDRFTGMFKMGGSRSGSLERSTRPVTKEPSPALPERSESSQKPLLKNTSSSTLPRPSPAKSDASQTSSVSRPLVPGRRPDVAPAPAPSKPLLRKTK